MKKRFNYIKRTFLLSLSSLMLLANSPISAQNKLAPDQNPNYMKSLEKYMEKKDELIKHQGTTIQDTYEAIDDIQIKKDRKKLKRANRQKRRMARIENNGYNNYNYIPYRYNYSSSFNNGYQNGYGYNNFYRQYNQYRPYRYNSCSNYNPYYRPFSSYTINAGNAALWGVGAYLLLR